MSSNWAYPLFLWPRPECQVEALNLPTPLFWNSGELSKDSLYHFLLRNHQTVCPAAEQVCCPSSSLVNQRRQSHWWYTREIYLSHPFPTEFVYLFYAACFIDPVPHLLSDFSFPLKSDQKLSLVPLFYYPPTPLFACAQTTPSVQHSFHDFPLGYSCQGGRI